MKKYIEAIEETENEDKDFIQEEVEKDYSEAKKKVAKDKVKLKEKVGKTYKYRLHTCYHDEEVSGSCQTEDIS